MRRSINWGQGWGQGDRYHVPVMDAEGKVVQKNLYDADGRLIKTIDAAGYLSASNDESRYGVEYTYDMGGRITAISTPESKQKGKTSQSYTCDAEGNLITATDGEGNIITYERDMWGKPVKVTDAKGAETLYTYDYAGNLISSTDGNRNVTCYTYNSMNLVETMNDPAGKTVTYKYDKEGRLRLETDRNSQNILYDYNSDNNLTLKELSGGNEQELYLYNRDGSLLAAVDSKGVDEFTYDANSLLTKKVRNGKTVLQYEYNKNGAVTNVKDETGASTAYTYDTLGRLGTVLDGSSPIATYSYNPVYLVNGPKNYCFLSSKKV